MFTMLREIIPNMSISFTTSLVNQQCICLSFKIGVIHLKHTHNRQTIYWSHKSNVFCVIVKHIK